MCDWIFTIIFLIGFIRLATVIAGYVKYAIVFFGSPLNLAQRYGTGSWVFITGGSGGIGGAVAVNLAKKGFNIIIISRNAKLLEANAQKCKEANPDCQVKCIVRDLSGGTDVEFYQKIVDEVKDLDISILVNNAGTASFRRFQNHDVDDVSRTIKLNSVQPVMFTSLLLEKLRSRAKRSAMINISSVVGLQAYGHIPLYTSTKSVLYYASQSWAEEFRDKIDFLLVCPGIVNTDLTKGYPYPDNVSPEYAAEYFLKRLGRTEECSAAFVHEVAYYWILDPIFHASNHAWTFLVEKFYIPLTDNVLVKHNPK